MDPGPDPSSDDPVVVTGAGHVLDTPCDSTPFLKTRKNRKFMGVQDELAVVAAGRALAGAGMSGAALGERAGLYLAVGYIPFEQEHIDVLLAHSVEGEDRHLSMRRFSSEAFGALNPLLTFRCLPNMPAFHISVNFDVQGPYLVTYPGPGQLYVALEEAVAGLHAGSIDLALVGGVAHQRNFLVEHHYSRLDPPVPLSFLRDSAACLVLERSSRAGSRARARLRELNVSYAPHHPFEESLVPDETTSGGVSPEGDLGPASLPAFLSLSLPSGDRTLGHRVRSRDGIHGSSVWGPA